MHARADSTRRQPPGPTWWWHPSAQRTKQLRTKGPERNHAADPSNRWEPTAPTIKHLIGPFAATMAIGGPHGVHEPVLTPAWAFKGATEMRDT